MTSKSNSPEIHLSKPGGRKEGPFTVEQINRDLAAKKYSDTDYWAWYEGLTQWVPLHSVPGVSATSGLAAATRASAGLQEIPAAQTGPPPGNVGHGPAPSLQQQLFSGMPISALEQIFVLAAGDGQAALRSAVAVGMLQAVTGQDLSAIRQNIPRHVIGQCTFLEQLRGAGAIPDAAWRAIANVNPDLVYQARQGTFRVCVRSFPLETGELATLFLFYHKQKSSQ
jgi:hypothetical protein